MGINIRLDTVKEKISEHEDITIMKHTNERK